MASIVFTEKAKRDLSAINSYIYETLRNPQAAKRIINGILSTTDKIGNCPYAYPIVHDEILSELGYRMTFFDNYNIFYHYDSQNNIVCINSILYDKADWKRILE